VSSADCRSAEQTRGCDHANHTRNRDGGAAGTLSSLGQSAELLELEDRLLVAIAGRGRLRIAQLIENVFGCQFHPEFKSKPLEPHPLFREFVGASYHHGQKKKEQKDAAVDEMFLRPEKLARR